MIQEKVTYTVVKKCSERGESPLLSTVDTHAVTMFLKNYRGDDLYNLDIIRCKGNGRDRDYIHICGDDWEERLRSWKAQHARKLRKELDKEIELRRKSTLDSVTSNNPITTAYLYSQLASEEGFDWDNIGGVESKAVEELHEILNSENNKDKIQEIGDLIFVLVNWMRWLGETNPSSVIWDVNKKFYKRFRLIEDKAAKDGRLVCECYKSELSRWWREDREDDDHE